MKLLRSLLVIAFLGCGLIEGQAQFMFMPNEQRLHLLDSLTRVMQILRRQPAGFPRDTALFFALDRYQYHYFDVNRPFAEIRQTMSFYPDSMYRIARRNHWPLGTAIALARRADAIGYLGDKASAVSLYKQALAIFARHPLPHEESLAFINLAVCFAYRKNVTGQDWEKTTEYMNKALVVARKNNDVVCIHQYYNLMGDFHIIRKQYKQALPFYEAERPLMLKHRYLSGYRTNLAYLGICYLHVNQEAKAWQYLDEFFKVSKSSEGAYATYLHHVVLYEISNYYLLNRKNYRKALTYQLEYERNLNERPLFNVTGHYEAMAQIYAGLKLYEKAYQYQQRYLASRDSLKLEDTERRFSQIEHELDLERKENQIKSLQNQTLQQTNKTQQSRLLFLGITFLLLAGVLILVIYSNRLKKKAMTSELRLASERNEIDTRIYQAEEAERKRIAADLHDDLGGTLATIRRKIADGRQQFQHTQAHQVFDELDPLIQKSGEDLRRIAHNLMPPEFARVGLRSTLEQFIQTIPHQPTHFEFLTTGQEVKLSVDTELTIYRIVSELIQNTLKHAHAKRASVQLLYHENRLCVLVEDDGVGSRAKKGDEPDGMGLKNSNLRADYIGATLRRETGTGGTMILLELPYSSLHATPDSSSDSSD
ncbi:tetratricopeptide repeat-containing sensor histidine kinase [Spirosoma validum]|uniref:histidine kinase n=1 Tax=Spirosoma validum TaxID=2771355 RepID=A0A927GE23_9BACT|nr:histidine kinase [Spirosoma validum]MBD2754165.1 hypothetical protein [Spirosoma validum]